jgi:hypothetical protein
MPAQLSRDALKGRWLRAPELDGSTGRVYIADRGAPSRPRAALELLADGSYLETKIGPTDRSARRSGRWHLDGDTLRLLAAEDAGSSRTIQVIEATPGRLVVKER